MKYKLVYIEWADATSNSGWFTEEEMKDWVKTSAWVVKQVGWVFEETPKYIALYGSIVDGVRDREVRYGQIQKIPKTWIRKRKVLKI